MRLHLLLAFSLAVFISSPAWATDWSCGDWEKDPAGKCEEIRTCTRTTCDAGEKLENCRKETRTECANPIPAEGSAPPSSPDAGTPGS